MVEFVQGADGLSVWWIIGLAAMVAVGMWINRKK